MWNNKEILIKDIDIKKLYWWLVGFTDGDGLFIASINKEYKVIQYKIGYHLHKEDILALENISKILKITVPFNKRKNSTLISIDIIRQDHIKNIIIIFIKYSLITIKYYSFIKWTI